jgi:hypothetical protein
MIELFRAVIANIVNPRRHTARAIIRKKMADQARYDAGHIVDRGEIPAHIAMVKLSTPTTSRPSASNFRAI